MRKKGWLALAVALALLAGAWGLHAAQSDPPSGGTGLVLLDSAEGVYVLAVAQRSAADEAGVAPGDYLLSAGESVLDTAAALDALIAQLPPAQRTVPLTLRRGGAVLRLSLPLN